MTAYLDTSAALKLLVDEVGSDVLPSLLIEFRGNLVASYLLHAELHCAAARRPDFISVAAVDSVLSTVELIDVERADLLRGPTIPGRLRAGDAIHLATAIRVRAATLVGYDAELNAAAEAAGLTVLAPQ